MIRGATKKRPRGMDDPALVRVMTRMGMTSVPLWDSESESRRHYRAAIKDLIPRRNGPVSDARVDTHNKEVLARRIKNKARELGADDVGICSLTPIMINQGVDCPFENVIAIIHHEDYLKVLDGADAVGEEAHRAYYTVAKISTELGEYIRKELGWPALAHHNGGSYLQAIPILQQAGFGELGKHGSLIHPKFGASFRPAFVTTNLPLLYDTPMAFGVQDRCLTCQVCINNCPGDAIPDDYVVTEGIRRWLTDVKKCYPYSRLRQEYCHLCVDVCPYNAPNHMVAYRTFMGDRRVLGYKTPKKRV